MMRSMFSGVSGLRTHQARMDVIGHNIANVNTVGFKSSRMTFADTFSQTIQGAAAPNAETGRGGTNPMQVGLGVNVSSIQRLMTTGGAQRTDDPFHLMIEGDGFFVVGDDIGGLFFTRAGDFQQDRDWNIHLNGLRLQGWQAPWGLGGPQRDALGEPQAIASGPVQGIQILPSMRNVQPTATGNITFEGNINPAEQTITRSINFHDSLGQTYSMQMQFRFISGEWHVFRADTTMRTSTTPNVEIDVAPLSPGGDGWVDTTVRLEFGTDGLPIMYTNATPPVAIVGAFEWYFPITGGGSATEPNFSFGQTFPSPPAPNANDNFIRVDFSGLTQYARATNAVAADVDGMESGDLVGLSIGPDGIVSGTYSNGQSFALWQIALATFSNPAGLQAMGSNLFSTTTNSGLFDGTGMTPATAGTRLLGGTLEMSNVDLGAEFTEMITTQRGFQANSRIITTSDEILQELVNLKR